MIQQYTVSEPRQYPRPSHCPACGEEDLMIERAERALVLPKRIRARLQRTAGVA